MYKTLLYLIMSIIVAIFIIKIYKEFKSSETIDEKVCIIILLVIIILPLIIFYLDYYNIPSKLKLVSDANIGNRLFQLISTFFSTIIGASIGAIALILMTNRQMNNERNKDNNDKRIQNMPLLNYDFTKQKGKKYREIYMYNETSIRDRSVYSLYIQIENIGLNHARHLRLKTYIFGTTYFKEDNLEYIQPILKVNDKLYLELVFEFNYSSNINDNMHKIKIILEYDDILGNKYSQEIIIDSLATGVFGGEYDGNLLKILNTKISNEQEIAVS